MSPITYARMNMYFALFAIGLIIARAAGGWETVSLLLAALAGLFFWVLLAVIVYSVFAKQGLRSSFGYTVGEFFFSLAGFLAVIATFTGGFWDIAGLVIWLALLVWNSYTLFDHFRTLHYRGLAGKAMLLADPRPGMRGSSEGGL